MRASVLEVGDEDPAELLANTNIGLAFGMAEILVTEVTELATMRL